LKIIMFLRPGPDNLNSRFPKLVTFLLFQYSDHETLLSFFSVNKLHYFWVREFLEGAERKNIKEHIKRKEFLFLKGIRPKYIYDLYKAGLSRCKFKSANWNWGLEGACEGGHKKIVEQMIELGATNWNLGLKGACHRGHKEIVDLMIERGATDWNEGLYWACEGGHKEIVELMIERGATDWNGGLREACQGGHKEIVDLMIERGATNWIWGLEGACDGGHKEIMELMIKRGGKHCEKCSG
jgi:hypothetical protein